MAFIDSQTFVWGYIAVVLPLVLFVLWLVTHRKPFFTTIRRESTGTITSYGLWDRLVTRLMYRLSDYHESRMEDLNDSLMQSESESLTVVGPLSFR